ncbi:MAG: chemotaxis protein CheD [Planctomycetes bacterium]|nr:chemotaxis protein CheD [Planctomycetota bacterium]
MSATITATTKKNNVGMGQIAFSQDDEPLFAILGSCLGVAIFCLRTKAAALAHVVLPASEGRDGPPGKFVDTAIPYLIDEIVKRGGNRKRLVAKLVGGASMFANAGPIQIGEANVIAAVNLLEKHGVRLTGKEVGGTAGRRILVQPYAREVVIEAKGKISVTI